MDISLDATAGIMQNQTYPGNLLTFAELDSGLFSSLTLHAKNSESALHAPPWSVDRNRRETGAKAAHMEAAVRGNHKISRPKRFQRPRFYINYNCQLRH